MIIEIILVLLIIAFAWLTWRHLRFMKACAERDQEIKKLLREVYIIRSAWAHQAHAAERQLAYEVKRHIELVESTTAITDAICAAIIGDRAALDLRLIDAFIAFKRRHKHQDQHKIQAFLKDFETKCNRLFDVFSRIDIL